MAESICNIQPVLRSGLRRAACVLLALWLLISSASASTLQNGDVKVTLPDSYTVITSENLDEQTDLLRRTGKKRRRISGLFLIRGACLSLCRQAATLKSP